MKKLFFLIALAIIGEHTIIGQVPRFHSATPGVQFKPHYKMFWSEPPAQYSKLSMDDVFYLGDNASSISVIFNKKLYLFSRKENPKTKKIKVEQIIKQKQQTVLSGVIKTISTNYESWTEPRIGKTRAAAGTMSSETIEAKYARQIINYVNASTDEKQQMTDSAIIVQKQFVSEDLFYFKLINNSSSNYYIYLIQNDPIGTSIVFNQTWGDPEEGEVGLVFCLPASSFLKIDSFVFCEDNETQYIPLASETKINIKLLQKELDEETASEEIESLLKIGTCINMPE